MRQAFDWSTSFLATINTFKHAQHIPDTLSASRDGAEYAGRVSRSLQSVYLGSRRTSHSRRGTGRELGTACAPLPSIVSITSSLNENSRCTSCKLLAHSRATRHRRRPRREDQIYTTHSGRHSQGASRHPLFTTRSKHSSSRC
jgi:hypothetical protein